MLTDNMLKQGAIILSIFGIGSSLDPLKMRTPCNGDFFTPNSVNRGGQTDARW